MSTAHADTDPGRPDLHADQITGAAWLDDMPAWGISLLAHGLIAVTLASISWVIVSETQQYELTSVVQVEEPPLPEFVIDTEISQVAGSMNPMKVDGASLAVAQIRGLETHPEEIQPLVEEIDSSVPMMLTLPDPSEAELLESVDLMGTTEHAGGTEGAIDRITWEIAASLRERRTIVVWLFDESLSLKKRRSRIADRFDSIYTQLSQMNVNAEENLTTGIVGFGAEVHMIQKTPGTTADGLTDKIRGLTNDESGKEFVFSAVDRAVRTFVKHKKEQRANLMLVVVTDERGDDFGELERIIRKCTRTGTRVYCIGNSAVFGREKGYVRYAWQAGEDRFEEDLPVDQGPETAMVEGLQLPFWTTGGLNLDRMSSGFGPYALTRLCTETGGIYFIADETQGPRFDPARMRQYAPDYRPQRDYEQQLSSNRAKAALVRAAGNAIPEDTMVRPRRSFLATSDTVLRRQITEAQKPLAKLDYYLQDLHRMLEQAEDHRDRLDTDRWRASYDLAMGRVLAMRVRAFGYNSVLAQMKSNPRPFESQESNQWILSPAEASDAGAGVRRLHKKAISYLSRVIDEHPSTPWAWLAKVELQEPLGWKWSEASVQLAPNRPRLTVNRPRVSPDDALRQQRQQRRNALRQATRPQL